MSTAVFKRNRVRDSKIDIPVRVLLRVLHYWKPFFQLLWIAFIGNSKEVSCASYWL